MQKPEKFRNQQFPKTDIRRYFNVIQKASEQENQSLENFSSSNRQKKLDSNLDNAKQEELKKIKKEIASVESIQDKIAKKRDLSREVENIQRALQPLQGRHKDF